MHFLVIFHGWLSVFLILFILDILIIASWYFSSPYLTSDSYFFCVCLLHIHAYWAGTCPAICISTWLSREVCLAGGRTVLMSLLTWKYSFSDGFHITWATVKLPITGTFCKDHAVCLTSNELSLCGLKNHFLCDRSLKCILISWIPNWFGLGWNYCSLCLAPDCPFHYCML